MTTRLESCTEHVAGPRSPVRPAPAAGGSGPRRTHSHAIWDIALGVSTAVYLALVLFDDIESPVISILFGVLVTYDLVQPHLRGGQW